MKELNTTLLLVIKNKQILLAEKKRGFFAGKINGVGGKQENGEAIVSTMIREAQEEAGITPKDYEKMAIIDFDEIVNGERMINHMHVYVADDFDGEIIESDEMRPMWFAIKNIPYNRMFEDDKFWLPEVLKGNKLVAKIVFNAEFVMLSKEISIVNREADLENI